MREIANCMREAVRHFVKLTRLAWCPDIGLAQLMPPSTEMRPRLIGEIIFVANS
jgi:hypothetical protein